MQQLSSTSLNSTFILHDPSQSQGFKKIYSTSLYFTINCIENNRTTQLQPQLIHLKLLLRLPQPSQMKLELTGDKDIYFNFQSRLNEQSFQDLKSKQNILVGFKEFVNIIIKNLESTSKDPTLHLVLNLYSNNNGRFLIIQKTEFKDYEIIALDLQKSSDQFIRDSIGYRYGEMKRVMGTVQEELRGIDEVIKAKNPSLLLQIRKKMGGVSFIKR